MNIKKIGFGLITLIVILFVVSPMFAAANTNVTSPNYDVNSKERTYKCDAFTKNTVQSNGKLTDNKPKYAITTVREDSKGFTIEAGGAFKEKMFLSNELTGPFNNFGSDSKTILSLRNDVPGALYFTIYTFADEQAPEDRPRNAPIENLTVLGQCRRTQ